MPLPVQDEPRDLPRMQCLKSMRRWLRKHRKPGKKNMVISIIQHNNEFTRNNTLSHKKSNCFCSIQIIFLILITSILWCKNFFPMANIFSFVCKEEKTSIQVWMYICFVLLIKIMYTKKDFMNHTVFLVLEISEIFCTNYMWTRTHKSRPQEP